MRKWPGPSADKLQLQLFVLFNSPKLEGCSPGASDKLLYPTNVVGIKDTTGDRPNDNIVRLR